MTVFDKPEKINLTGSGPVFRLTVMSLTGEAWLWQGRHVFDRIGMAWPG